MMKYEEFKRNTLNGIEIDPNFDEVYVSLGESSKDVISVEIRDTDIRDEYEEINEAWQSSEEYSEERDAAEERWRGFKDGLDQRDDLWKLLFNKYLEGLEE